MGNPSGKRRQEIVFDNVDNDLRYREVRRG
jgi:hypothetical protein